MTLVPKTIHGEIKWEDRFEVESLEAFTKEQNMRLREAGIDQDLFFVTSPRRVAERTGDGRLVMEYHVCKEDACELI